MNLTRWHLTESQRAMVAAKLANMRRGDNQHAQICATSQNDAAEMLNVGRRTVQQAREIQTKAAPDLTRAVESGDVSVSAAAAVAKTAKPEVQAELVKAGPRAVKAAAAAARANPKALDGEPAEVLKRVKRVATPKPAPAPEKPKAVISVEAACVTIARNAYAVSRYDGDAEWRAAMVEAMSEAKSKLDALIAELER